MMDQKLNLTTCCIDDFSFTEIDGKLYLYLIKGDIVELLNEEMAKNDESIKKCLYRLAHNGADPVV